LGWLVLLPLFFGIAYGGFIFTAQLLAAPFTELLSERIEVHLTGREPPPVTWQQNLRAMLIAWGSACRFLGKQLFMMLVTAPLLLVPGVGQLTWFLVSAYFNGLTFLDTAMARNRLSHAQKLAGLKTQRIEICGFGMALLALAVVPVAGWLVLPLGVAGAVVLYCRIAWQPAADDKAA
jgi:CysZ protein